MALLTIHVLEGMERGRVYRDLATPVTIGREEDNTVQLNDERISRFHAKIQDDHGHCILTDLDSTNGTRVNGHPTSVRVLLEGDVLQIGRCLLVYGDLPPGLMQRPSIGDSDELTEHAGVESPGSSRLVAPPAWLDDELFESDLFPGGPPGLPASLETLQQAQLSDLLAYVHERLSRAVARSVEEEQPDASRKVVIDWATWQLLIDLQRQLAVHLRDLGSNED